MVINMKKTTVTTTEKEYDAEGRVIKETVTVDETEINDNLMYPVYPAPQIYYAPHKQWSEVTCMSDSAIVRNE
jgi:hypothetical protein